MKTILNNIIWVVIAIFITSSCAKDFLTPLPTDSVSDEQIFSSVDAAQTALNAAHRYIGHYQNHTLSYIMSDVMGEDALMTTGSYGRPTYNWNVYSYSYAQTPVTSPWWTGYANYIWPINYKAIDHANSIITNLAKLTDDAKKKDLVARAYGVRGYCYLNLIRLFAPAYNADPNAKGVILRLTPADANSDHLPRASVKDVYAQIILDLKYAQENCGTANTDFITPRSAALLLARAYLDMNDYSNAKKYAEIAAANVFDGSNLMSKEEWKDGFKDHNSEWLWWHNFNPATCNIYASIPSFYYQAKGYPGYAFGSKVPVEKMDDGIEVWDGYGTVRFTKTFVDMFEDGDARKQFPFYFYEEDGYYTCKFGHRTMMGDAEFPMARIAEAYLIKAECEAKLGGGSAKSVLNALQVKRGATPTDATLDNIYIERRKELYGEGHRLHDIKRLRQPLNRTAPEHWAKLNLPADSPRFMLPIPENEMLYNKALTPADQNTYWK